MDAGLNSIIADKISGSRDILIRLNDYFIANNGKFPINLELISKLRSEFSDFQTIQTYLSKVESAIVQRRNTDTEFFKNLKLELNSTAEQIFHNHKNLLKDINSVVTISNSKTLTDIFRLFRKELHPLTINVCESRPLFEGRIMAEAIAQFGNKVNLITEAASGNAVKNSDAVFLGADKILPDGSIVNKIGSANLAILANYYHKKVIVFADKSKLSQTNEIEINENPSEEIYRNSNSLICVTNTYFEIVEKTLITIICTD